MTTTLILSLAAATSGPLSFLLGPFLGVADFLAVAFSLGVALWTLRQYGRPARAPLLAKVMLAPEFDGPRKDLVKCADYRDAA